MASEEDMGAGQSVTEQEAAEAPTQAEGINAAPATQDAVEAPAEGVEAAEASVAPAEAAQAELSADGGGDALDAEASRESEGSAQPAAKASAAPEPEEEEAEEMMITEDGVEEEELLFTIDAAGVPEAAPEPEAVEEAKEGEKEENEAKEACSTCGLPGHDASACPFAHPEDIELGDLEESDSDDELSELYPLFSRYVQQHVGALTPKDRRGLTGGGRYFGQEKQQACWACAETGHDADNCPDKGCFFCSKKGHDARDCPQKRIRCSHCGLRGHAPVSCPTLAAMRLADFSQVRCMRCGIMGHPNCGPAPKATETPATQAMPSLREQAEKQQMLEKIAEGRARSRAWDTAPWRQREEGPAKATKVNKADMPVPDLML